MNTFIDIISNAPAKDAEGFVTTGDNILASLRAYKEVRNTSTKWERIIGNAAFSGATTLFRFRKILGVAVTASLFITDSDGRYNIINAEDVQGRGMYVEVLAERIEGSVK